MENTSAEAITDEVEGFPSADTVLGNLRKQKWETIKRDLEEIIKYTIEIAKQQRWFSRSVTLAIDFHEDLYYGEIENKYIVNAESKKGAKAFRIATIDVLEYGERYCLAWLPCKKGVRKAVVVGSYSRK